VSTKSGAAVSRPVSTTYTSTPQPRRGMRVGELETEKRAGERQGRWEQGVRQERLERGMWEWGVRYR
jgi:hypothetical protein